MHCGVGKCKLSPTVRLYTDVGNKVIYSHVWTTGGNRQQLRQQRTLRRRMNLRFSHRERVGDTDSIAGGFERVLVAMLPIIVVTGRSFIRFNAVDLWRSVALRPSSAALTTLAIVAAVRIADNDRRATGVLDISTSPLFSLRTALSALRRGDTSFLDRPVNSKFPPQTSSILYPMFVSFSLGSKSKRITTNGSLHTARINPSRTCRLRARAFTCVGVDAKWCTQMCEQRY